MQMISILVDNAFKYTPDGGEIFFCLKSNGGKIELVEENTCTVGAIDDPERLFERFYRVNKSHSKTIGGTGLGLSIVKHGALLHHARIELNSELNVGTTISIIF